MEDNNRSNYLPLLIIILAIILGASAIEAAHSEFHLRHFANYFMGLFFLLFAMFKLFNLKGFADGFQMYDIIAKRKREYAYAYPFIELTLGLLYLSGYLHFMTCLVTIILMSVSAVGVIKSVFSGMNLRCACLGTVLNVPLSTVSIIENVGMGIMAVVMLFGVFG